jgi:predicted Zn-dependent protease
MGTVRLVIALSGELFDAIEVDAARSGNHKRAAVRMRTLATEAAPSEMSRAEAHMRAGEQWLLAEEPAEAADEFRAAIALGGQTFADPRIQLARALYALDGQDDEAEAIIEDLAETGRTDPRTCDMVAEVLIEQGDLAGALDWATAGVDACMRAGDRDELPLLLRLRYRLRIDLGLDEDDYDRLLDARPKTAPKPRPAVP